MKKTALMRKINFPFLLSIFVLATVLFFAGCKDDEEETPDAPKAPKVNCVILSKVQIQTWVDSGWTKPGSQGQINEVVLQFLGSNGGSSLQLLGYPGSSPVNVKDNGKVTLAIDTSCAIKGFTGEVIFGNNILKLDSLNIFNKEGGLNNFDYIRLTPEQQYPPYLNFKVEVITKGQVGDGTGNTRPCPTWCD
jgi:hypothetical protein